ncbi:MAG: hypothetical protein JST54_27020 [Deltaproteobacteria bacterium]|nr:hypothetical protein [Deltaproteobacteria bacterium]
MKSDDQAEFCTLYLPSVDYGLVKLVRRRFGKGVAVDGNDSDWKRIVVETRSGTTTISSTVWRKPGDKASTTLLGTRAFLVREFSGHRYLEQICSRVLATKWLLGVRMAPTLDSDPRTAPMLLELAKNAGGMIFNGSSMLDAEGEQLLIEK